MPRVKRELKNLGVVEIAVYKFNGNPTTHWSLNIQKFTELYNEIIQKKISKYPDGVKPNTPMGQNYNKHIKQASYTKTTTAPPD